MHWGRYEISTFNFGMFRLDGGAMFGSVPKNIWNKKIQGDNENCIQLATRSLVIRQGKTLILVDVGMGQKWNEKQSKIFGLSDSVGTTNSSISRTAWPFEPTQVTDIILTHLHFDHAGGISRYKPGSANELELVFPQARVIVQSDNLNNARSPNIKERASYLKENVEPLLKANLLQVSGEVEVFPDILVHQVNGHTKGQQLIEIKNGSKSIYFTTDLIPTSHHLPLPFHMGYDICAETILEEKEQLLHKVLDSDSILVFQHDPSICACKVIKDDKGHYAVGEKFEI